MRRLFCMLVLTAAPFIAGCGNGDAPGPTGGGAFDSYFVKEAPGNPLAVNEVREKAADGATVVVFGRLKEFTSEFASFRLIDKSLESCRQTGDGCPTPWDYCCEDTDAVNASQVLVELREGARPRRGGLKGVGGLDHLAVVTVTGEVEKDAEGNIIVVAREIHVQG